MELTRTTNNTLSPDSQYFKFATADTDALIDTHESKAILYDIAAKVATVGAAILLLGAVAGVTAGVLLLTGGNVLIAAVAGAAVLFIGYAIYRMCLKGVIPVEGTDQKYGIHYLAHLSNEHHQRAETEKKIAGIATELLQNGKAESQSSAKPFARAVYWNRLSKEKEKELTSLQEKIQQTRNKIDTANQNGEDTSADLQVLSSLLRDQYRIEVEELATAKIMTAYIRHIFNHPDETRSLEEMITPQIKSYNDHTTLERTNLPTSVLSIPGQSNRFITLQEIKKMDPVKLSQELFSTPLESI